MPAACLKTHVPLCMWLGLSRPGCTAGKNYLVQDGDVIFFKFNVTASGKK